MTTQNTDVGLAYSALFPDNVGHLILNSTVAPEGEQVTIRLKGIGAEQAFDGFAQWAAERDATYHLGTIEKPFVVNDRGPRDVMILQDLADPSAAYVGALQSRMALGQRAEMVSVRAIGRGGPLTDSCVGADVESFLLHDVLAAHDVTCS